MTMLLVSIGVIVYVCCVYLNWGWFYPFLLLDLQKDGLHLRHPVNVWTHRKLAWESFGLATIFSVLLPFSIFLTVLITQIAKHGWIIPFTKQDPARLIR